ncbi:MAG: dihydroorotate dehydrogenase [Candidatus Aminicenantes bacterium]|nr:dihydroorotate dehydrogenase [Candidatus Aminicenantes bacterium]
MTVRSAVDLSVDLGFLRLKNPVLAASGTFGYGPEFEPFLDPGRLGGFVVKGLHFDPRPGNPPPRLAETPSGLINAVGLQGVGVASFCEKTLPRLRGYKTAVIVNVCGADTEEYVRVVEYLDGHEGIAAYELNISCPNVKAGGACPAQSPAATRKVVAAVKKRSRRPVITKLSPNVTDVAAVAAAAEEAGTDAVSLVNTFLAMAVDVETRRPKVANVYGGLSGPAIRPIALRMVHQTASRVRIPVIGLGGIATASDALEFLIAGARAVQVGTAGLVDPRAALDIIDGLEEYCRRHSLQRLSEICGTIDVR